MSEGYVGMWICVLFIGAIIVISFALGGSSCKRLDNIDRHFNIDSNKEDCDTNTHIITVYRMIDIPKGGEKHE